MLDQQLSARSARLVHVVGIVPSERAQLRIRGHADDVKGDDLLVDVVPQQRPAYRILVAPEIASRRFAGDDRTRAGIRRCVRALCRRDFGPSRSLEVSVAKR